jgi:aspartate carbamoyltransferase catalytic subunit
LSDWNHRHVLDLAAFSLADYATVLELAQRFRVMPTTGARKLPALQGRLVTVRTYVAMGADLLVVRHRCTGVPASLARDLEASGDRVAVLNGGDGLHSHPSQGLLDLFTLARHFAPDAPTPQALAGRRIVIVGDVLHSRVARSNLWALTACGADVVLCGPPTLLPSSFAEFVAAPPPGQASDPVASRGRIIVDYDLVRMR